MLTVKLFCRAFLVAYNPIAVVIIRAKSGVF